MFFNIVIYSFLIKMLLNFVPHVVLENHKDFLLHCPALFIMLLWNFGV